MEMCQREGLHQIDLLNGGREKITEREYWAKKRGQAEKDVLNKKIIADGLTPRQPKFETEKELLRQSIWSVLSTAVSFEDFPQSSCRITGLKSKKAGGDTVTLPQTEPSQSLPEVRNRF